MNKHAGRLRFWLGAILSPLAPTATIAIFAIRSAQRDGQLSSDDINLVVGFSVLFCLPLAWASTLLLGVPILFWRSRSRSLRPLEILPGGVLLGALVVTVLTTLMFSFSAWSIAVGACLGLITAAVFVLIAGIPWTSGD